MPTLPSVPTALLNAEGEINFSDIQTELALQ
jgi:hypothetical protein